MRFPLLCSRGKLREWVVILDSLHTVDLVQLLVMGGARNIVLGVVLISLHTVDLVQTVIVGWARGVILAQVQKMMVGR